MKAIIDGLMYDTDKATKIEDLYDSVIFRTDNGRFFKAFKNSEWRKILHGQEIY